MSVRVAVHVHPRAARSRGNWNGTTLELWVTEPPVDGAANTAVVRAVAAWAGVRRSAVVLVAGDTGRHKVAVVDGISSLPPPDTPW